MKNYNENEGVWRTIRGRRVFIRKGQNLADAMKESGKFKDLKRADVTLARQELENRELHKQTMDMEKAYSTNRYKFGQDYWGDKWRQATKYEREGKEFIENYYNGNEATNVSKTINYNAKTRVDRYKNYGNDKVEEFKNKQQSNNGTNWREQVKANKEQMQKDLETYEKEKDPFGRNINNDAIHDGYYEIYRNTERANAKIKQELPNEKYEYVEAYAGYKDKFDQTWGNDGAGSKMVSAKMYTNDEFMEHLTDANWHTERKMLEEANLTNRQLEYVKDNTKVGAWSTDLDKSRTEQLINEAKTKYSETSKAQERLNKISSNNGTIEKITNDRIKENKIVDSFNNQVVYQNENANYVTDRKSYNDYVNGKTNRLGGYLALNEKEAREIMAEWDAEEKYPYEGYVKDMKTGNSEKARKLKQENLDKIYKSIGYPDEKYNYGLEKKATANEIVNDDNEGFEYSFRTNKRDIFEVRYNRVGSNKNMDFATSASTFNRNRTDIEMGGQAQNDILKEGSYAKEFYKKWDGKHLSKLTRGEYNDLLKDVEKLKNKYPYVEGSRFYDQVELDRKYSNMKTTSTGAKVQKSAMDNTIEQFRNKKQSNVGVKSTVSTITEKEVRGIRTQKALKGLIESGKATDITRLSDEQTKTLREKHGHLEKVKVTSGTYGMNGALLRSSKTGEYFVITSRNGNLFYWV